MESIKTSNKEYILKFNFRALTELQDEGISFTDEQEFKLKDLAKIIHIGLKKYHKLSFDEVMDLMDDLLAENTFEELMVKASKALQESMGKQTATIPAPVKK